MVEQYIILVDKNNRKIGVEEKIKAHKEGKLHRAFSILVCGCPTSTEVRIF